MSLKSSDKTVNIKVVAWGVLRDTLLLLLLLFAIPTTYAHHRDTLGIGDLTYFVENLGQWSQPFRYQAQMHNAAFFAESNCFTIVLKEPTPVAADGHFHHQAGQRAHAYRVQFVGASPNVDIMGHDIDANGGYDNYYYGKDPNKWVTRLPHYWTLYYSNLYPGIDLDVRVAQTALKSNFYVAAGADPARIVMRYDGAERIYKSNENLIIQTSVGEIVELKPYAYQNCDTGRCEIDIRYQIKGDEVRFIVGDYDHTLPLTIDPILHFSTYTGSTADNWGTTATYDHEKNAYTAGLVFGMGYPVSLGAYDSYYNGNADIGIFKFDSTGTQRLFATYLGGGRADMPHSMYVNAFDELVIFGTTGSSDFPVTTGAYDTTFNGGSNVLFENTSSISFANGSDIFISRFSSDGAELQASTYVGGTGNDGLNYHQYFNQDYYTIMDGNDSLYYNYGDGARGELITDDLNNVYVGSTTTSLDFPVSENAIQTNAWIGQNGVVFKIDYNLRNMIWSTYLGGIKDDAVYSIDVDNEYNLLVCGGTNSSNFPTTSGCFQPSYGGGSADGFVAKISYNGDNLMASTFFGSSSYDQLYFVRSGRHNEVFVYGQTTAPGSTMIYNALYNVPGSGMLLARLQPDLSQRDWSTVFGTPLGRPNLSPTAFAADICNRVYAAGWGRDFVGTRVTWNQAGTTGMETTPDAYQNTTDGQDFYIMSIDADASHLDYATFFGELHNAASPNGGSDHVDGGTSRFDKMATLYQSVCASCSGNNGFPITPGAWSDHNNSNNCNNALFRFNIHSDFAVADFIAPPVSCAPYTINFSNSGRGTRFLWDFGDGTTSTLRNPQHTYTQPGTYTVTLIAYIDEGCQTSDTATSTVWVLNERGSNQMSQASCDGSPIQIGPTPMTGCTYRWISGNVSDSTIANPYVNHSGRYILRITANEGCQEYDTFNITYINLLDTFFVISPTCPGGRDGRAVAVVPSDISDSAHYYWDGVEGDSILYGLAADSMQHTLHIDCFGCSIDRTFTVQDPPTLQYTVDAQTALCGDNCDGWIHIVSTLPGDYPVGDTLLDNLCEGVYHIEIHDTAGCPYTSVTEIVRDTALRHIRVWADDTVFFLSESVQLHVTPVDGASYSWYNPATLDNAHSDHPVATPVDTITVYEVDVVDSMGCTWHGSIMLRCTEVICGRPNIYIPNAFSPNGDGINDRLNFRGNYVLDFHLSIFTRWGEKVFETHDINDSWDGLYNGNPCLPGVYTYYCKIKCEAGFDNLLKGDITLIR